MRVKPLKFVPVVFSDPAAYWPGFKAVNCLARYEINCTGNKEWHWYTTSDSHYGRTETYEQAVQEANEHHTRAVLSLLEEDTNATTL